MSEDCQVLYQCTCMTVLCVVILLIKKKSIRIPSIDILKLCLLGAIGIGGTDYLISLAFARLDVGTAIMIHFIFPTLVLLSMIVFGGRKVTFLSVSAVVLSIIGLFCAVTSHTGLSLIGLVGALGSAITCAIFMIANERSAVAHYPSALRMFYMSLGAMAVALVKVVLSGTFSLPANKNVALILFGVVSLITATGYILLAYGTQLIGAEVASFLDLLEPVFGAIFGWIIYREVITLKAFIGYLLIPLSIYLIAEDSARMRRTEDGADTRKQHST